MEKRRERAIEGFGDGAEQTGFGFLDDAVGGDGEGAGVENVFLDLGDGLDQAVEGGVNLLEAALV